LIESYDPGYQATVETFFASQSLTESGQDFSELDLRG